MSAVSIIVPVYNERDSLRELLRQIDAMAATNPQVGHPEVVLVDDGSTDGSWEVIESLAATRPGTLGVRFRRNFGKAAALSAGFERAGGEVYVTMDADLQDDPAEVPRLLAAVEGGLDCVSGWKQRRHDPWHKTYPSRVFNRMINSLTGLNLHDHNCGLKAYRAEIFQEVQIYGELHRFVPSLAAARGFKVGELVVNHRPRTAGVSKYGFERFIKGFLDLLTVYFLTAFRNRPQHLLGRAGLGIFAVGTLVLTVLTASWILTRIFDLGGVVHLHQSALFYYSILAMLLGAQLLSIGFIAELVTALHRSPAPPYSVAQTAGGGRSRIAAGGPTSPTPPPASPYSTGIRDGQSSTSEA